MYGIDLAFLLLRLKFGFVEQEDGLLNAHIQAVFLCTVLSITVGLQEFFN